MLQVMRRSYFLPLAALVMSVIGLLLVIFADKNGSYGSVGGVLLVAGLAIGAALRFFYGPTMVPKQPLDPAVVALFRRAAAKAVHDPMRGRPERSAGAEPPPGSDAPGGTDPG
jgi:hypothetical protein